MSHQGSERLSLFAQTRVFRISFNKVLGEGLIPLVWGQGMLLNITEAYPALGTPLHTSPPKGSNKILLYLLISVKESFPSKHRIKLQ
jgi:hypothetical protein